MSNELKLEEVAELLEVPTTTVVAWLAELNLAMRWSRGRYVIPSESLEALRLRADRGVSICS
ncbi:MAG: hypothetical protein AUK47_28180 [Deltaproteobacteria bacterium CG2_30_63_29]|nr:MAG: hypothetical protein AUK47_28180 [Deltaproteobacteria bacterium CG2_30_63_29]PJB41685.1 MAG: hypothetical protein CO108_12710 [Deltaproteobacteria bacterium CG_4_9_14_3_um_filter_63_12]